MKLEKSKGHKLKKKHIGDLMDKLTRPINRATQVNMSNP